jgi:hypothetical protein
MFVSLLVRRLFPLFSHKHKRSTKLTKFWHVIVVVFCCTKSPYLMVQESTQERLLLLWYFVVQKSPCLMVQESTQERLFLWCGKQVFLLGMSPHFVPLPMQPMRRLSIGTLSSHEGSSSPLFPMLFSSCSHGCSQKVPQVFLSCSPLPTPKDIHSQSMLKSLPPYLNVNGKRCDVISMT